MAIFAGKEIEEALVGRSETPRELGERLKREEIFRRYTQRLVAAIREYEMDPDWPGHAGKLLRTTDAAESALRLERVVDVVDAS